MDPAVSIIMPCYNVAPYLRAAWESIRAQTFGDFEVIAVDDGSTDGTAETLARIAAEDDRVRVLSQPNRGVSSARNRGLDAVRGKYVFFVDPDDTVRPDLLARVHARLEETQAECCIFAYRRRFGARGVWRTMPLLENYAYASTAAIVAGVFPHMFGYSDAQARFWGRRGNLQLGREEGSVCRMGYRADALRRACTRFDETIVLYEDAMFNCEFLLAANSMTFLNEPLYDYTVRTDGAVTVNNRTATIFTNKLRMLAKRRQLDARTGGRLWPYYSASCVFSVLEMLHALVTVRGCRRIGLATLREYVAQPEFVRACATFPWPARRPLAALILLVLRIRARFA